MEFLEKEILMFLIRNSFEFFILIVSIISIGTFILYLKKKIRFIYFLFIMILIMYLPKPIMYIKSNFLDVIEYKYIFSFNTKNGYIAYIFKAKADELFDELENIVKKENMSERDYMDIKNTINVFFKDNDEINIDSKSYLYTKSIILMMDNPKIVK